MTPTARPDVSIILATRNRAASLRQALERLAHQDTGGRFTYDVLVIDNNSTDATRSVVTELARVFPVPLRYVHESTAGKSFALNAGLRRAAGSVLAMTDDDVLPEPGWLAGLWSCLTQENADAVTGRMLPKWDAPLPAWMTQEMARDVNRLGIGCVDHGAERRRSWERQDCRWVGGNLAIRRDAAQRVGFFNTRLARGQDSDYYDRCLQRGLRVAYEPSAMARHRIDAARLTVPAFRRWRRRQGYYEASLLPWKPTHLFTIMPLWRVRLTITRIGRWLSAVLTRRSAWERFRCELKVWEEVGAWGQRLSRWPSGVRAVLAGRSSAP